MLLPRHGIPTARSTSTLLNLVRFAGSITRVCDEGSTLLISHTANLQLICLRGGKSKIPPNPIALTNSFFLSSKQGMTSYKCLMDERDDPTQNSTLLFTPDKSILVDQWPLLGKANIIVPKKKHEESRCN